MKLKAFMRKLTSILLAVLSAMCLTGICYAEETTTATVPTADVTADTVARAGRETLYAGGGSIGSFYLEGNNLTPVKTMGISGEFTLFGRATCSSTKAWWVRVQILDAYTGDVLASTKTYSSTGLDTIQDYSMSINVTKGQKIQIYTYYTSTPSEEARITLNYTLG